MLINGAAADSVSGETMEVYDPYFGTLIDTVPKATAEDIDAAITAAQKAQKEWAAVPLHKRVSILLKFRDLIRENQASLAETLCRDNGKPYSQAFGEIGNWFVSIPAFCERAKHYYEQVIPAGQEPGQEHTLQYVKREPVGIVLCIIPFNFPSNLMSQKVLPSLLMGNAAIVMPPSGNPLTDMRLCHLLAEAGAPAGVIQCVTAPGAVKEAAITDPRIGFISLTGSTEVGVRVAELAAKNLTPYALELGGNDPFIVFEDADMDVALSEVYPGRLVNAGQICCACKRFIVHRSRLEEFTKGVVDIAKSLKSEDPMLPETRFTCLINEKAAIEVEKQVNLTVDQGAKILAGGHRDGTKYEATVLGDVTPDMDIAKDMEVFGPVIPIIPFDTEEEALEIANNSIYGLASCIFTENSRRIARMASRLEAGDVIVNGASRLRTFEMPFGGWKMSGVGTEGVMCTFDEVTRTKVIILKDMLP
ncbi:MAG: aldehyde dehydrogenase family protein [Bacillota bacterium]|nr:aldehyde dehydrogenase family protein [Bacillota bacterium]